MTKNSQQNQTWWYCWWLKSCTPVEVGSLSHYLQGFIHPKWLAGFFPISSTPFAPSMKQNLESFTLEPQVEHCLGAVSDVSEKKTATRKRERKKRWRLDVFYLGITVLFFVFVLCVFLSGKKAPICWTKKLTFRRRCCDMCENVSGEVYNEDLWRFIGPSLLHMAAIWLSDFTPYSVFASMPLSVSTCTYIHTY